MTVIAAEAAIQAIMHNGYDQPLLRLVEAAAHLSDAPGCMLTARLDGQDHVLAARGTAFANIPRVLKALAGTDRFFTNGPVIVPDVRDHPLLACHPLTINRPAWRWVAIVPLSIPGAQSQFALTVGDPRVGVNRTSNLLDRLHRIGAVIADEIELIGEIALQAERPDNVTRSSCECKHGTLPLFDAMRTAAEPQAVVSEFLLSTLIWQRRLLKRNSVPYHGLARWRSTTKAWQIAALKALKRDPPEALVDTVAAQIADAARALYGTQTFQAIAAVSCGNSGPRCLARRLAERTAEKTGVPFIDAFEPLPMSGASHPKRNINRPSMILRNASSVPTLLIDDVATSGAHIEEAALLLRTTAPAVLPMVWIAA